MSGSNTITFSGDWKEFQKFLDAGWTKELISEINKATRAGAYKVMSEIRKRIRERRYEPNRPSTLIDKARRKSGTRPLIDRGVMLKAMDVQKMGVVADGDFKFSKFHVGFLKDQQTSDGHSTLFKAIPALHEGATIVQTTKSGKTRVIRIPKRPFLSAVFEDKEVWAVVNKLWTEAIQRVLKKHGKL